MSPDACKRALIAKLASQGTEHVPERSTELSLFFKTKSGKGLTVPCPLEEFGWSYDQQEFISRTLEYYELDFWPLDYNA